MDDRCESCMKRPATHTEEVEVQSRGVAYEVIGTYTVRICDWCYTLPKVAEEE